MTLRHKGHDEGRFHPECLACQARPEQDTAVQLLREAKPHLYAVDRKGWCNCDITIPGSSHDPDCKWIADVEKVGSLRVAIDRFLATADVDEEAGK